MRRQELLDELLAAHEGPLHGRLRLSEVHGKEAGQVALALEVIESLLRDALVVHLAPGSPMINQDRQREIQAWARARAPRSLFRGLRTLREAHAAQVVNISGRVILERVYMQICA